MTVDNTTYKTTAAGNGSTTNFPVTQFEVLETSDVVVTLINDTTGRRTQQTVTTHYTVTLDNPSDLPSTFDVDFVTAPASGETVEIRRDRSKLQGITFPTGGNFPSNSANFMADSLAMGHIDDAWHRELQRSMLTFAIAGNNYVVTLNEAEYHFGAYKFTGSPTAGISSLLLPAGINMSGWVHNKHGTNGAFIWVLVNGAGGDYISLNWNVSAYFFSDGTDVTATIIGTDFT